MDGRSGNDPDEVEWQFDVHDLRPVLRGIEAGAHEGAGGVSVERSRTLNQVDTYLDTQDRLLDRAGFSLRLRRSRRRPTVATFESLRPNGRAADGARMQLELQQELELDGRDGLELGAGPVTERVEAVTGGRELVPLFEMQTRRRTFVLSVDGAAAGELLIDETAIREPRGRILSGLRRIVVEAPAAARCLVEPFVDNLRAAGGLAPAALSKYEAGLAARGLDRTAPQARGPRRIGA